VATLTALDDDPAVTAAAAAAVVAAAAVATGARSRCSALATARSGAGASAGDGESATVTAREDSNNENASTALSHNSSSSRGVSGYVLNVAATGGVDRGAITRALLAVTTPLSLTPTVAQSASHPTAVESIPAEAFAEAESRQFRAELAAAAQSPAAASLSSPAAAAVDVPAVAEEACFRVLVRGIAVSTAALSAAVALHRQQRLQQPASSPFCSSSRPCCCALPVGLVPFARQQLLVCLDLSHRNPLAAQALASRARLTPLADSAPSASTAAATAAATAARTGDDESDGAALTGLGVVASLYALSRAATAMTAHNARVNTTADHSDSGAEGAGAESMRCVCCSARRSGGDTSSHACGLASLSALAAPALGVLVNCLEAAPQQTAAAVAALRCRVTLSSTGPRGSESSDTGSAQLDNACVGAALDTASSDASAGDASGTEDIFSLMFAAAATDDTASADTSGSSAATLSSAPKTVSRTETLGAPLWLLLWH